jgi:hypothetical protein
MSDAGFTPLFNSPPGGTSPDSLKIVPGGSANQSFQPLTPHTSGAPTAGAKPACGPQPIITVKKDKDRVTRISIKCGCGQVIELECQY